MSLVAAAGGHWKSKSSGLSEKVDKCVQKGTDERTNALCHRTAWKQASKVLKTIPLPPMLRIHTNFEMLLCLFMYLYISSRETYWPWQIYFQFEKWIFQGESRKARWVRLKPEWKSRLPIVLFSFFFSYDVVGTEKPRYVSSLCHGRRAIEGPANKAEKETEQKVTNSYKSEDVRQL